MYTKNDKFKDQTARSKRNEGQVCIKDMVKIDLSYLFTRTS